jgi:hypothetical protein
MAFPHQACPCGAEKLDIGEDSRRSQQFSHSLELGESEDQIQIV